ncbi:hypothetical protein LTR17_024516 [Elasticomyces elasticus]|nr:hypothetical protein LTR17_024516 [Elasticomyces elasticus]
MCKARTDLAIIWVPEWKTSVASSTANTRPIAFVEFPCYYTACVTSPDNPQHIQMLAPKVCALVLLSLVPDATAITRWAWAKYRIAMITYADAHCKQRITANDVHNEYGDRYILKSGKKCHTFPEPLRSYAYQFDPHTAVDSPTDKLCSIDVYEGQDCADYA